MSRSINKGITLVGHMTYALEHKQDPNTILEWLIAERDGHDPRFRPEAYERVARIYDQKAADAGYCRVKGRYVRVKAVVPARGRRDVYKSPSKIKKGKNAK